MIFKTDCPTKRRVRVCKGDFSSSPDMVHFLFAKFRLCGRKFGLQYKLNVLYKVDMAGS